MTIIYFLFWVLCASLMLAVIVTISWFCFAMLVNFWKIYFKKKPKKDVVECDHSNIIYDEGHPEKIWKCTGCGQRF